jgi:5-methylcytosine-specific restriction enzyme subunit McrC
MTEPRVVLQEEHGNIAELVRKFGINYLPQPPNNDITKIWVFGLRPDGYLSYYIGLDWLDEGKIALRVSSKIEGADHHAMLNECLKSPVASRYLGEAYDIRADHPFIVSANDDAEILPLLVIHFLVLLEDLLRKPLKKGYVFREENLQSKMKGKVLLNIHMTKNVFGMRPDRVMCRYQEYSTDCQENRLIHSAYTISSKYLVSWGETTRRYYLDSMRFASLENYFGGIGFIERDSELKSIKSNPVYREYGEVLRLARLIYRIRGYREKHGERDIYSVPPYIIDMSKLFELYVYALLYNAVGKDIDYQVHGKGGGIVDFLDTTRKLVVDAKYKPIYETSFDMDNMRQVAGYARNTALLDKLGVENRDQVVDCLIIYPQTGANDLTSDHYKYGREAIKEYNKIFKLGIAVPSRVEA